MPVCAIKDNEKFAFGNECIFEIENCKNKGGEFLESIDMWQFL